MKLRVLVVDDEQPARRRLLDLTVDRRPAADGTDVLTSYLSPLPPLALYLAGTTALGTASGTSSEQVQGPSSNR